MAINKIDIDEIISVIHSNVKDPETKKSLIEDIKKIQAEKEAEKEEAKADGPKAKNKHVFFLRKEGDKFSDAGFLAKIPVDSPTSDLLERIQQASAAQNNKPKKSNRGRKGKGGKIEKYYDFFHGSKREFSKQVNINPVKELVEVVILPSEEIDFSN